MSEPKTNSYVFEVGALRLNEVVMLEASICKTLREAQKEFKALRDHFIDSPYHVVVLLNQRYTIVDRDTQAVSIYNHVVQRYEAN